MNRPSTHRSKGFTVIELIVVIALLGIVTLLFFAQRHNLDTANKDERRKIAINAIYYNLEEVYYPKNGYYPQELSDKVLTAMDSSLLTDTEGIKIDQKLDTSTLDDSQKKALEGVDSRLSEYIYDPTNCDNEGKCKSYTLRVALENEAEFVKKSRRN